MGRPCILWKKQLGLRIASDCRRSDDLLQYLRFNARPGVEHSLPRRVGLPTVRCFLY